MSLSIAAQAEELAQLWTHTVGVESATATVAPDSHAAASTDRPIPVR
jgi:hypothetical protein